jgi:hypothetical protein
MYGKLKVQLQAFITPALRIRTWLIYHWCKNSRYKMNRSLIRSQVLSGCEQERKLPHPKWNPVTRLSTLYCRHTSDNGVCLRHDGCTWSPLTTVHRFLIPPQTHTHTHTHTHDNRKENLRSLLENDPLTHTHTFIVSAETGSSLIYHQPYDVQAITGNGRQTSLQQLVCVDKHNNKALHKALISTMYSVLFHQRNAQYQLYVNIWGESPTRFSACVQSSGRTVCHF